ncbi:RING finger protein [Pyricularia oryzae Y34]|uniref:RING finger protein n=2 Tax=Pyricularia oryzae TaxID=318829 RepID=A0AA97PI25_PYRO3|nr:RING finger protein [Pyricularia oryzae Y34]
MFSQQPSPATSSPPLLSPGTSLPSVSPANAQAQPSRTNIAASPSVATAASAAAVTVAGSSGHRSSRLRGLSYLKNYTQNHLLNRDLNKESNSNPASPGSPDSPPPQSSTFNPQTIPAQIKASRPVSRLLRSVSYSPTSSPAPTTAAIGILSAASPASVSTSPVTTPPPISPTSRHNRFSLGPASASLFLSPETFDNTFDTAHRSPSPFLSTASPVNSPQFEFASSSSASVRPEPQTEALATDPLSTKTSALPRLRPSSLAPPHTNCPGTDVEPAALDLDDVNTAAGTMTRMRAATASDAAVLAQNGGASTDAMPSIRFTTFCDPRATRPSLTFTPVSRTLPTGTEIIRVGRYSERDVPPNVPINVPSAAPVGFKSKVVSRRHCEFWNEDGKWYIKDVKSSSGTFLNHIRLSPPGTESKPFPVNDGDIVQLGIDFKGGEEMIFRCVKMRLELNRGWQNKLNAFNMTTHKRLRNMTKSDPNGASQTSQDCSICLNSIASLLMSAQYPIFICPNCRAAADLEAEVEDPEEWEQLDSEEEEATDAANAPASTQPKNDSLAAASQAGDPLQGQSQLSNAQGTQAEVVSQPNGTASQTTPGRSATPSHATSMPMPIPRASSDVTRRPVPSSTMEMDVDTPSTPRDLRQTRTPSPASNGPAPLGVAEGPITPRNDAGPWVFDGGVISRLGASTTLASPAVVEGSITPHNAGGAQVTSIDDIARA